MGEAASRPKRAIIILNFGDISKDGNTRNFLFNLFFDKRIIDLPRPLRFIIANIIAFRRSKTTQEISNKLGSNNLSENTQKQATLIENALNSLDPNANYKTFVSMRYSSPYAFDVIKQVMEYKPDEVFLLPLYPQYSTTTTLSAFDSWEEALEQYNKILPSDIFVVYEYKIRLWVKKLYQMILQKINKNTPPPTTALEEEIINNSQGEKLESIIKSIVPHKLLCCFSDLNGFIETLGNALINALKGIPPNKKIKILISAHGLPMKIVNKGDPYPAQVEYSAKKLMEYININYKIPQENEVVVCYQSKVGPMEWLTPATDKEIIKAAATNMAIVIVPISFVSEHSETVVELDQEYYELAKKSGAEIYVRIPTVQFDQKFIETLAKLVISEINKTQQNNCLCEKLNGNVKCCYNNLIKEFSVLSKIIK